MPVPTVHGRRAAVRDRAGGDASPRDATSRSSPPASPSAGRSRPPTLLVVRRHRRGGDEPVDDPADRSRRDRARRASRGPIVTVEEHTVLRRTRAARSRKWSSRRTRCGCACSASPACLRRPVRRSSCSITSASRRRAFAPRRASWCGAERHAAHVLAIDQGTTNTKVLLFDERAAVVAQASRAGADRVPAAWLGRAGRDRASGAASRRRSTSACAAAPGAAGRCGRRHQPARVRAAVGAGDRPAGRPGHRLAVPAHDATSARRFASAASQAHLESATGLTIDPLFSASKLRWLLDAHPRAMARAERGELCAGTIDSWLIWNLTGGAVHACDATNASRTQLLNLRSAAWDAELLVALLDPGRRPAGSPAVERHLRRGHRDSRARGHADRQRDWRFACRALRTRRLCAGPGEGDLRHGFVADDARASAASRSRHGLSTTIAWSVDGRSQYALEGNITVTGSAVEWIGQIVGLAAPAASAGDLARSVDDTGGVYFVPALAGLGAPLLGRRRRAGCCAASAAARPPRISRAPASSRSPTRSATSSTRCARTPARRRRCSPTAAPARNDALMQFQADILGVPVDPHRRPPTCRRSAPRGWPVSRSASGATRRAVAAASTDDSRSSRRMADDRARARSTPAGATPSAARAAVDGRAAGEPARNGPPRRAASDGQGRAPVLPRRTAAGRRSPIASTSTSPRSRGCSSAPRRRASSA